MTRNRKFALIAACAVLVGGLAVGTGVAQAGGDDDAKDTPITGAEFDKASAAALAHTGGGRVTASEVGDEEGYYEVEVTRADGSQVDVHLNRDFTVTGSNADPADTK